MNNCLDVKEKSKVVLNEREQVTSKELPGNVLRSPPCRNSFEYFPGLNRESQLFFMVFLQKRPSVNISAELAKKAFFLKKPFDTARKEN